MQVAFTLSHDDVAENSFQARFVASLADVAVVALQRLLSAVGPRRIRSCPYIACDKRPEKTRREKEYEDLKARARGGLFAPPDTSDLECGVVFVASKGQRWCRDHGEAVRLERQRESTTETPGRREVEDTPEEKVVCGKKAQMTSLYGIARELLDLPCRDL